MPEPSNGHGLPKDPARYGVWLVTGGLSFLALFFGVVSGVPWPAKDLMNQVRADILRLDRTDESHVAEIRSLGLSLQALQYEHRQLRDQQQWLEAELDRLKAYVYPHPSGRIPRPKASGARPPDALGPPTTKYP